MVVILAVFPGCGPGDGGPTPSAADWPMFRGDPEHTGQATSAITLPLTLKWSFQAGSALLSSPAVSGDRLFVGSYAVKAATGKKLWEFETGGPVTNSPAVSGDMVYFGSYEMRICALNAATGKKVWEFQTDN